MSEKGLRMLDRDHPPGDAEVRPWIGEGAYEHWRTVTESIERLYPGIFRAEWLYGGKKHGWSLRYKKSRPLCTLVPEKGRFLVLLVFGAAEWEKVEAVRDSLSRRTVAEYDAATTYHDGKWVVLTIDGQEAIEDLELLWAVKRKPKKGATASEGGSR
ncbi:MAG: DUF3788 domain-containing protein [Thermoleophilia bacterium]|nr:DUF3788 domain-containing protein [Thermoleophilia bacterium]